MEAKDLLKVNSILLATYGCIIMTVQIEVDSIEYLSWTRTGIYWTSR